MQGMSFSTPLTGWISAPIAESAILLQVQYLQDERSDLASPERIQFVLHPKQALELAELLQRMAARILAQGRPDIQGH
jgi:hypothetical protein